ncbi:hypothetical protein BS47DRAFT_1373693 [Hydnum rufescens UP504]|uniref:CP-type G domain-containing protein n=1 Tax=Hydnum rufescens UP504 TaxID=1448309 RepID=A0A9P6AM10_9AGAM|nr:hypothetical protein BS47DRAFT_1373693 [Hydnum rufescens UP504]
MPKSKNTVGLGHAILNKRAKDAKEKRTNSNYAIAPDSPANLKSVTQERDLDEFLSTAQLAATDFAAERQNIKIIQAPGVGSSSAANPFLLSADEEKAALSKHSQYKKSLRVPRRPPWTKSMTAVEVDKQEREAFLNWRRGLAMLQETENFLFTPFERNIEVWRQLWRVLERSHLIVQIIDARNPLRFRCEDLEDYVYNVEGPEGERGTGRGLRKALLLVNKADLLSLNQRRQWADYFEANGVKYAFFSAANSKALQEARLAAEQALMQPPSNEEEDSDGDTETNNSDNDSEFSQPIPILDIPASARAEAEASVIDQDPRTRVLSVLELEKLFIESAPDLQSRVTQYQRKLVVGLVGYPNVGKSSTINALLGEKKVSVSSTPGKTKHFQTIHLSPSILLCDCPGLVFPQFATSKADLVCDGVLPIDQLREHTAPVALLVQRIATPMLEGMYGLSIYRKSVEEGGDGKITAEDFLKSYAIARGFTRAGQGNPDEARAARYILKDYQQQTLEALQRAGKKKAPTTRVGKDADTFVPNRSRNLDNDFFRNGTGLSSRAFVKGGPADREEFTRTMFYPHQHAIGNDGRPIDGVSLPAPIAPKDKKHFKGAKHVKHRSGKGYD